MFVATCIPNSNIRKYSLEVAMICGHNVPRPPKKKKKSECVVKYSSHYRVKVILIVKEAVFSFNSVYVYDN